MEEGHAPKWFDSVTKQDVTMSDIPLDQLPERVTIDLSTPQEEEEEEDEERKGSEEGWKMMDQVSKTHGKVVSNNGVVGVPRLLNKRALTKARPFKVRGEWERGKGKGERGKEKGERGKGKGEGEWEREREYYDYHIMIISSYYCYYYYFF